MFHRASAARPRPPGNRIRPREWNPLQVITRRWNMARNPGVNGGRFLTKNCGFFNDKAAPETAYTAKLRAGTGAWARAGGRRVTARTTAMPPTAKDPTKSHW